MINIEDTLYREFGRDYAQGSVIFKEGDPGDRVYFIQSGKVRIDKSVGERFKTLGVLARGDLFGEMALISDRPRTATATAVEACRLVALDSGTFFRILRSSYDVTVKVIEQLAARLAEADRRLETLLFTDATTRLVRYLEETPAGAPPMGAEQLAYELGVPQERLQRILGKLVEKGMAESGRGGVRLKDRGKLEKLKNYLNLKEEFGQID